MICTTIYSCILVQLAQMQIDTANHGHIRWAIFGREHREKKPNRQKKMEEENEGRRRRSNCFVWHVRFRDLRGGAIFFRFVSCHLILGFLAFLAHGCQLRNGSSLSHLCLFHSWRIVWPESFFPERLFWRNCWSLPLENAMVVSPKVTYLPT